MMIMSPAWEMAKNEWVAVPGSEGITAEWLATCPSSNPPQRCCTASSINASYVHVRAYNK